MARLRIDPAPLGEYPVLSGEIETSPRIAALILSSDYRQRKRGWRLLAEQQRRQNWAAQEAQDNLFARLAGVMGTSYDELTRGWQGPGHPIPDATVSRCVNKEK